MASPREPTSGSKGRASAAKPAEPAAWGLPERLALLLVIGGVVSAIGVALVLVLSGVDNEPTTISATTRPVATPTVTIPPARTVTRCTPIFGKGGPYAVNSSADGAPAACSEAHAVLLTALNHDAAHVGSWRCVTDLRGPRLAICKADSRKIVATE